MDFLLITPPQTDARDITSLAGDSPPDVILFHHTLWCILLSHLRDAVAQLTIALMYNIRKFVSQRQHDFSTRKLKKRIVIGFTGLSFIWKLNV